MQIYILIGLIALCAFLPRYLPWVVFSGRPLSSRMERILGMIPASVIAALIIPDVININNGVSLAIFIQPYFLASVFTFLTMIFSKRLIFSSFLGIGVFFTLKLLLITHS